jgi:hypothetical protein
MLQTVVILELADRVLKAAGERWQDGEERSYSNRMLSSLATTKLRQLGLLVPPIRENTSVQ